MGFRSDIVVRTAGGCFACLGGAAKPEAVIASPRLQIIPFVKFGLRTHPQGWITLSARQHAVHPIGPLSESQNCAQILSKLTRGRLLALGSCSGYIIYVYPTSVGKMSYLLFVR